MHLEIRRFVIPKWMNFELNVMYSAIKSALSCDVMCGKGSVVDLTFWNLAPARHLARDKWSSRPFSLQIHISGAIKSG